jgi:hypothetical protein
VGPVEEAAGQYRSVRGAWVVSRRTEGRGDGETERRREGEIEGGKEDH